MLLPAAEYFVLKYCRRVLLVYSTILITSPKEGAGYIRSHYTPGIYAEGYVDFVFPFVRSSVRMFVCSSVCDSAPSVELLQSFTLKFLK